MAVFGRLTRWILVFVVTGLILIQPATAQTTQKKDLVRLSFGNGWSALPAIVGIEAGFFDEQNLIVSGLSYSDERAVIKSVVIGSSDFAAVPQRTFIVAAGSSLPVKALALNGTGLVIDLVVPTASEVAAVSELKGKTIAVGAGSEAYPVLMRLLNLHGMRPSDVKLRFLSGSDLVTVFDKSQADALIETRHYTQLLMAQGKAKALVPYADIVKQLGVVGSQALIARDELIKDEPHVVQRFVNAWAKALLFINQKPEDAARFLTIYFHRQGVVVRDEDAKNWVSYLNYGRVVWNQNDIADAEYNGWGLVEGQIIKNSPKLQPFVESSFAEAAYAALQ